MGGRGAGRPLRWWVGLGLLACGVGLLAYLGWQTWVTTWLARREHAAIVEALEEGWAGRTATDEAGAVEVDVGRATAVLTVPRFGDDFAVPVLDGVSDDVLAAGVGHFEDAAGPGERGNFALAGHRVTHGEPFRDLPELRPGDEVVVTTRDAVHTYVLDTGGDDLTVTFTDTWVTAPVPRNPDPDGVGPAPGERRLLTLTTCSELFHTDDRLVAFGHLVSTEPRA